MLLPFLILGALLAAASGGSSSKTVKLSSAQALKFAALKRKLNDKAKQSFQRFGYQFTRFTDPSESLTSNPVKYWDAVVLPKHLVPAWQRIIQGSVGAMAQASWDKNLDPGDRPTADIDQDGTGRNLLWANAYAADRAMRDAIIFGVITTGAIPEGTDESERVLGENPDKGAVTAEHVAAATGTTAAVLGSLAAGTIASTVTTTVASSLVAVGVPATMATTIGSAAGSAAGLAAAAGGVATVAAAVWPAAAMAAALAAIVSILWGAIGSARGHTLRSYLVNGRPATPDVEEATALRDAGGRMSDALALIEPMDVLIQDAYEKVYPGESPPVSLPKISGPEIAEQAELEDWIANFLLHHWGMPWTEPYALVFRNYASAGIEMPENLHGFEWIGDCTEAGMKQPPASTEGRRRVLAVFAGLGEREAAWLAKKPGTRGPFPA